jgi:putative MATE family efflux protein
MQASGDTVMPMKITIFFRIIHVALCPFLVLGWWIFPPLGVSGAALSVVIAQGLGMVIGFWVLFSGRTRLRLSLRNFRLDLNNIWRQVKISIPASIMNMQRAFGNLILTRFMAYFGTLAVGGHGLAQRVEMLLAMPTQAMGVGAGVLVGQNLGAKQPERAERSGWLATGFAEAFMVICAVVTVVWAESIAGIFTSEPDLVGITGTFLKIAAAGYLVQGLNGILQNCISGAGDTLPPMVISLVVVWVLQLPLAFLLSRVTGLGMYGVRWAIVAGIAVGTVAYIMYFRWGRWKRKRV